MKHNGTHVQTQKNICRVVICQYRLDTCFETWDQDRPILKLLATSNWLKCWCYTSLNRYVLFTGTDFELQIEAKIICYIAYNADQGNHDRWSTTLGAQRCSYGVRTIAIQLQRKFFYPRDAMLARVFATATYLSVCLSVTRRYCA